MRAALRRRIEPLVRQWWRGGAGIWGPVLTALALIPSALFTMVVRVRGLLFDTGIRTPVQVPIPVISVGNLTVGGTGKTPVTSWVVSELLAMGRRPAVVSRGYGDDETRLLARWHPGVPILTSPDRVAGVRRAMAAGCDVAVLDDGFQHRRIARELDLVLLSPAQSLPARLLPRGPYREPLRALRRADLVFVTQKGGEEADAGRLVRDLASTAGFPPIHLLPVAFAGWKDLSGADASAPGGEVLAIASVAHPESVRAQACRLLQRDVELLTFPDHHGYSSSDVVAITARAAGRSLVTTEKDAVKLETFASELPETHVLALEPAPTRAAAAALQEALSEALARAGEPMPS